MSEDLKVYFIYNWYEQPVFKKLMEMDPYCLSSTRADCSLIFKIEDQQASMLKLSCDAEIYSVTEMIERWKKVSEASKGLDRWTYDNARREILSLKDVNQRQGQEEFSKHISDYLNKVVTRGAS